MGVCRITQVNAKPSTSVVVMLRAGNGRYSPANDHAQIKIIDFLIGPCRFLEYLSNAMTKYMFLFRGNSP